MRSERAGINLSAYVELGANDKFEISLQNYGFSRSVASELNKFYKEFIKFDSENIVVFIDTVSILSRLSKNSIAFSEHSNI